NNMLQVDLHCHTFFSSCGIHSHLEMLKHAHELGLKGLAITDHGPAVGGRINSVFFERLAQPVPGIRLLKGIEANPLARDYSRLDIPSQFLPYMDIILVGIHQNIPAGKAPGYYTDIYITLMKDNPAVDIITHPAQTAYPVEYPRLTRAARQYGVALEINNSKTSLKRVPDTQTGKLIKFCKKNRCQIAVNSDAHVLNEIGRDDSVRPIIKELAFPEELIINSTAAKAFNFIKERRKNKQRQDGLKS
ncbi:MAG TPA: PHP domain-containing protein, partial [Spirochaetota bacterium]|nr:PHP domain-containing protein [Spirochaetota bacterium]